ncbi:MAG TPA: SH3 domain-containing protein [Candidatus Sulfomarinibacteraceae bacterium]|nr:SH3 domain-containing protein [Candidatus Sulfomarinibacteraceae bacterium]
MEEERPIYDARENLEDREPATMSSTGRTTNGETRSTFPGLMIVGVVLVVSLLIAGLFLPPISLGQRLGLGAGETTTEQGAADVGNALSLTLQDGASEVAASVVPAADLAGNEETAALAQAAPASTEFRSDVYLLDYEGAAPQGSLSLALPEGAGSTANLDMYGWDGSAWRFIPLRSVADGRFVSASLPLPRAVALMETSAPESASVGIEVLPAQELPAAVLPHVTEVVAGTLTLTENGQLRGEAAEVASGGYQQYVRVTNGGVVVDQVSLASLLSDEQQRQAHVQDLVEAAGPYAGVNLDYQGVAPGQREAFTTLVEELAEALHEADKELIVTLGTPPAADEGEWNTGGQDWQAIGQLADALYLQLPLNPAAYSAEGPAQELVAWSVRQVHRHKLNVLVTANAVDAVGSVVRELPHTQALANFGELSLMEGSEVITVGSPVEVGLAGSAGPLEWDSDGKMYRYTYEQAGQEHTVWLSNEASASERMRLASAYNLRGVTLRGLDEAVAGEGYALALDTYLNGSDAPEPGGAAIVWTVEDEDESVVASSSGEALSYRWEDTNEPGRYMVNAVFAQGDAVASLGALPIEVEAAATPTPEPTATPEAEEEEAAPQATATPAETVAQLDPGEADAVNNISSNFRTGPGLGYSVIEVLPGGTQLSLLGRNAAGDWYQVRVVGTDKEGWLFGNLLSINSGVDTNALAVIEVDPPATSSGDTPAAPPPVVGGGAGGGFELGGQTHTLANPTLMQQAGMNWVKFQHKWGPGDSPDALAGRIGHAHGNGMKVLLSIPGANTYPDSIDFNAYVEFLRGVAALGPDAIEVWNEMNIDFEWPAGQIDPTSYVNNMLAPAYNAIKSANPNVMVISGAPAPTGFDNGTNAWADDRYMAGVAAAGGANYMDCIGVHYNAGATPPGASSGHPAGSNHYSWYFQPTLNMYYNAFGGARPVCFTELGYLSGQDFGGVPSRFSWASGTTVAQHAEWLGQAVSMAGNSGQVRMVIVFNVDFTHWGDDPQAGYAMLRPDGSCPACDTLRAAMGR